MKTLLIIGVLISLSLVSYYFIFNNKKQQRPQSVAVIPFENASRDPDKELLIDGLTDGVLNSLSRQQGIKVSARASSFKFRGSEADLEEIRARLGVEAVVEGFVTIDGDRIQVKVQVINAKDEMRLWSDSYEGKVEDIFALQDRIANNIAEALMTSSREVTTQRTASKEAYELYLKGRAYWNLRTQRDLLNGIDAFEQAIKEDPSFGAAYAGLGDCYTALGYLSMLSPKESFPKASAAASRALEFDSTLAEAHATLGYYKFYYEWDWQEAEQEFRKAISLNPNHELVYDWYGYYLTAMQRYDEAEIVFGKAAELDPLSAPISTDVGFGLYYGGQYDRALLALNEALQLNPKNPAAHLWLGRTYQAKEMYDEAISEYKQTMEGIPDWPVAYAQIGNVYGVSGNHNEARIILDSLNSFSSKKFVTSYGVALVYAGLGEKAKAYEWLNKAFDERSHWLVWLQTDPRWDPFRTDIEFIRLLARIALPGKSE